MQFGMDLEIWLCERNNSPKFLSWQSSSRMFPPILLTLRCNLCNPSNPPKWWYVSNQIVLAQIKKCQVFQGTNFHWNLTLYLVITCNEGMGPRKWRKQIAINSHIHTRKDLYRTWQGINGHVFCELEGDHVMTKKNSSFSQCLTNWSRTNKVHGQGTSFFFYMDRPTWECNLAYGFIRISFFTL